ncbi:MAG: GFA family protein [Gammaproteobacteria bacterium]|nr:GFA family protein [Gammaproteobacteria bacterium]
MHTYHGSCHCGAIRYEVELDLHRVTRCTCSICRKKGALLARADPQRLRILQGEEHMQLYQFNQMIARHYFCPTCGIHTFGNPRAAPHLFVVNVNTLDDYDLDAEQPEIRVFDGRNWETAIGEHRFDDAPRR